MPIQKFKQASVFARLIAAVCAVVGMSTTAFALPDDHIDESREETSSSHSSPGDIKPNRTQMPMSKIAANPPNIDKSYLSELGIERITDEPIDGISEYKVISNGLKVLFVERHETPVVSTTMVYHVGSRNEAVGYTGSTHFLEHMMFKGTPTFDPLKKTGIDDVLKKVGGINNATTWYDRTNYFEVVPSAHLELCLKIEADRIRNLLLRESDRQAEMTVVRNELERGEDSSSELLESNLFSTAFKEHPYHHPVIGWRSDVEGVPTARLKTFYDEFYYPDNATLMVIGDFNSKEALKLVSQYFKGIEKSPHPYPAVYTTEPPQEGERRFTVRRGVDLPRVAVGFHVPECLNKDTYALDIAETILGDSEKRSSRLYKRLVETGMANEIACYAYALKDPGLFVVTAQSNIGVEPAKLEVAILDELNKLATLGPTEEEMTKAKKSIIKSLRLSVTDPMGLSGQLTEAISSASWRWWVDYPNKIDKVTAEEVKAAIKRYVTEDNRTVGFYFPKKEEKGKGKGAATAESEKEKQREAGEEPAKAGSDSPPKVAPGEIKPSNDNSETPTSAAAEPAKPGDAEKLPPTTGGAPAETANDPVSSLILSKQKHTINIGKRVKKLKLKNGISLLLLPLEGNQTVALSGRINAGDHFCTQEKSQVPFFVSEMLTKGSTKYTKEALADELEHMGTSLDFSSGSFWTSFDTQVVKEDIDKMFEVVSDTLKNPTFPADELKLEKTMRFSDLQEHLADTGDVSWNAFLRKLYKPTNGFYQKDFDGQIAEVNTINQKDLKAFHKQHYIPGNFSLALVGDITEEQATALCEKYFGDWVGEKREPIAVTQKDVNSIQKAEEVVSEIPDKANVDVVMGRTVDVDLLSKEYFAAVLGNAALGYDSFSCRLAPVRDKYGLTYGISSSIDDPTQPFGPWSIKFSVNPENLKKAKEIVSNIVNEYLKEGISESELQIEKSHLSGVFSVYLRSPRHIASRLSFYDLAGVDLSYIDSYPDNLDKVTVQDVNDAIRKYFKLDDAVTSISGTLKKK
ncbi:MAG: pitrilysin family protein [Candidatus Melainabacteria bacterium]|nr:pitrilysin family protein [Candidatus Melainabacteria bacterium]